MKCYVGIDVGTSSAKALAVDRDGNVLAVHREEYDLLSPHGGWSEQAPEAWWTACASALRDLTRDVATLGGQIEAMAVSNQMHSLVMLDPERRVLRPAILHNDARTGAQMRQIAGTLGPEGERLTHNPIVNGMTLPSLLWVRDNEPENYARLRWVLTPGDYVRLRLTDRLATDHANASATLLYDFEAGGWSRRTMGLFDLDPDWFPPCFDSDEAAGTVTEAAGRETGLLPGTPVVFGGADQVMQSVGCGAIFPGMATVNIGSGGQVCVQTERLMDNPAAGVNALVGLYRDRHYMMGANTNAGSAYKWFCREILREADYDALNREIADVPPGSEGLVFLPYLNGERCPHRSAELSGVFWGMTYHTQRRHMARAVMEGVAYSLLDCLNACVDSGARVERMTALGGAVNSPAWLQIQADVYNLPLRTTASREQAVLGAAIAAAVGCSAFSGFGEACGRMVRYSEEAVMPSPRRHDVYMRYYDLYRRIYRKAVTELEEVTRLGRSGGCEP